jgi:hypothetical protein
VAAATLRGYLWGLEMSVVTIRGRKALNGNVRPSWVSDRYPLFTSDGREGYEDTYWQVQLHIYPDLIARKVWRGGELLDRGCHGTEPEGVIWPTWPARSDHEAAMSDLPLAEVETYWSTTGNRLRDSSKWMATVLGLALATIAGTSPLSEMANGKRESIAFASGALGLLLLFIALFLIVQVMRPQSVSYADVQYAKERKPRLNRKLFYKKPLFKLRTMVEDEPDLYLPCGIRCLTGLREAMIIEEVTLMALSRVGADPEAQDFRQLVCDAQVARATRLHDLRIAATRIATIGEYYVLRCRSSWATYGGVACGLLGTICIIVAFVWPLAGQLRR